MQVQSGSILNYTRYMMTFGSDLV